MSKNIFAPKKQNPDYLAGYRAALQAGWTERGYLIRPEEPAEPSALFLDGFQFAEQMRLNARGQGYQACNDYRYFTEPGAEKPLDPPEHHRDIWGVALADCLLYNPWEDFCLGWKEHRKLWLRGTWGHKTEPFEAREFATQALWTATPDAVRGGFELDYQNEAQRFVTWRAFDEEFVPASQPPHWKERS